MIRYGFVLLTSTLALVLSGCGTTPGGVYPAYQPRPQQGVYVVPRYQLPQPTRSLTPVDQCNALLYQGLRGQHEGSIYLQGLPGRQRILKPAFSEDFAVEMFNGASPTPPLYEVREYLAGQRIYDPSISTLSDGLRLGPVVQDRLTIELDADGYVAEVSCA